MLMIDTITTATNGGKEANEGGTITTGTATIAIAIDGTIIGLIVGIVGDDYTGSCPIIFSQFLLPRPIIAIEIGTDEAIWLRDVVATPGIVASIAGRKGAGNTRFAELSNALGVTGIIDGVVIVNNLTVNNLTRRNARRKRPRRKRQSV